MKRLVLKFLAITLLIVSIPYAKKMKKMRYNCVEKTHKAIKKYEKGRFSDAKIILDEVKINCNGSEIIDTAIYYLAKANLGAKSPQAALLELQSHLQDFPNSPFSEEVSFLIGVANYDQSPNYERDQTKTKYAISEFENFISLYPNSPFADSSKIYIKKCRTKLAKKEYMTADLYYRLKKFGSAVIYYQSVIDKYNSSEYLEPASLALAKCLTRVSRLEEAKQVLNGILDSDFSTKSKADAKQALARIIKFGERAEFSERERKRALKKELKLKANTKPVKAVE